MEPILVLVCVAWFAGWAAEGWNRRFLQKIGVPSAELPSRRRVGITATLFAGIVVAVWIAECQNFSLFPNLMRESLGTNVSSWFEPLVWRTFALHAMLLLILWMVSLIDCDERLIPDSLVVTGTLLGLAASVWLNDCGPQVPLPEGDGIDTGAFPYVPLSVTSPQRWTVGTYEGIGSLVMAMGIFWAWCFAMAPRSWYPRHGVRRAMGLCWARMRRSRASVGWLIVAVVGTGCILFVRMRSSGGSLGGNELSGNTGEWRGLYSALIGLGVGGGLVWYVRCIGQWVLRQEAMGFGDVTLMAMLGVWFGWQGAVVIFLFAPLFGLIFGILMVVVQKRPMPYGPFLAMVATGLLLQWREIWRFLEPTLLLFTRTEIALVGGGMLLLMGPLLWIVRTVRVRLFGNG